MSWTKCPHCRKWVQADRHECIGFVSIFDRSYPCIHGNMMHCPDCEQVRELERMWRLK